MQQAVRSYRNLKVWQRGIALTEAIYKVSGDFLDDEVYGLTSQICRVVVSIPSNIAEGWGRGSNKQYIRFLRIARCLVHEVETQLIIAQRLQYIEGEGVALSCRRRRQRAKCFFP